MNLRRPPTVFPQIVWQKERRSDNRKIDSIDLFKQFVTQLFSEYTVKMCYVPIENQFENKNGINSI